MGWLVAHDVVPAWTAQEVPVMRATDAMRAAQGQSEHVLYDQHGELGRMWTTHLIDEGSIRRDDVIMIDRLPIDVAPLRLLVASTFTAKGELDELTIVMENSEHQFRVHGERFDTDFSFTLDSGDSRPKSFKVPLSGGSMVTAAFNPFSTLTDLRVGQRWRVQVINPLSAFVPVGDKFFRVLVEVTGEERIKTIGGEVNCLVVESPNMKAWVDKTGAVVKQEMTLPLIGAMRIERASGFDKDAMNAVKRRDMGAPKRNRSRLTDS